MARIFVSHSSKDQEQAERLLAWLRAQGFNDTFLDIDKHGGLMPGDDWERRLYREIAGSEAVILILTANWFQSRWCFAEFIQARALGKAIFPILDTPTGESFVSPDIQHLDLVKDREGGLERLGSELTQLALNARGRFPWDTGRPPFPGLLAFDEADAAIYFGRDDDIRRVIERLNARRAQGGTKLVVVLGASGSGKSSLLRAGVLPRLKRDPRNWIVLPPFRPQLHPIDEFAQALAAGIGPNTNWRQCRDALMADDLRRSLSDIARDLRAAHAQNEAQILVSIDQAEELFTTADKADAERMLASLHAALDERLQFLVLMTMRSDHLGLLQEVPGLQFEEFSLKPMPLDRVRDIIEGPAKVAGLVVEEALISAAAKDAATEDALPLLAFTLRELRDRDGGDRLRLVSYQALGDETAKLSPLENALRKRADDVLKAANPDADELAALRAAFVPAMVRVNEEGEYVRRPAHWNSLPAKAHALLRRLADARLLVIGQEQQQTIVEVAHEALLRKWPRLREWLDEEREFLIGKMQLERALLDWQHADDAHKTAALLYGLPLIRAEQWLKDHPAALSDDEKRYITASQDHSRTEQRRKTMLRRMVAAGVGLALIMLAGAAWLGREWTLEKERTLAEGRRASAALLAFRSQSYLASGALKEAAVHALSAFDLSPSGETRSALLQTVIAVSPYLTRTLDVGELRPAALAWAPDGKSVLIGGLSGEVRTWRPFAERAEGDTDLVFGEQQGAGNAGSPVRSVTWTQDQGISLVYGDGRLVSLSAGGGAPSVNDVLSPDLRKASADASGLRIVAPSQTDPAVYLFACQKRAPDARDLTCARTEIVAEYANVAAISGNAAFAAAGLENGEVVVTDLATHESVARVDLGAKAQSLAWEKNGRWLAVGTVTGRTVIIDTKGETVAELPAQTSSVTALAWDATASRLAGACDGFAVCIWEQLSNSGTGFTLAATLSGHLNTVLDVAWSADGSMLTTTSADQSVKVWSLAADRTVFALPATDAASLTDVAVSPDRQWLAAGDMSGGIQVWNLQTLVHAGTLRSERGSEIKSVSWAPSGGLLATSDADGWVSAWRWPATEPERESQVAESAIDTVRWLADGTTVAAALRNGKVVLWSARDGTTVEMRGRHPESALGLAVDLPKNRVISSGDRGEVLVWNAARREQVATLPATDTASVPMTARDIVALDGAGRRALVAGNDGNLIIYDLESQRIDKVLRGNSPQIEGAAFNADASMAASTSSDGFLDIRVVGDGTTFAAVRVYPDDKRSGDGRTYHLRRLVWLPEYNGVAIGTSNGEIRIVSHDTAAWQRRLRSVFRLN